MKFPSRTYPEVWKDFYHNPLTVYFIAGFVVIHGLCLTLYYAAPDLLRKISIEDGPCENASALMYLIACFLFILMFKDTKEKWNRFWAVIFALGFFILAGEEISWGQRIFDFNVVAVEQVNLQREFNLHNLESFPISPTRMLSLCSLGFGILLPLLLTFSKFSRNTLQNYFKFPLPHPVIGTCFLLSWLWYRLFYTQQEVMMIAVEETRETTLALGFLTYAIFAYLVRARKTAEVIAPETTHA